MKTSFKMVAMLLGMGIFPLCAHAQKKVIIEDEEPNSIMFVSRDKAGDEIIRIMNDRSQMRFTTRTLPAFCSLTKRVSLFRHRRICPRNSGV